MKQPCSATRTSTSPLNPWISRRRPDSGARLRLFCFPYAGGGTVVFHGWRIDRPEGVEVCSILMPGRESRLREPAFDRLPALIKVLAEAICPYLDRPFAFFGHSMGALIAFELARYLRARGNPTPHHLFVSAARAPQRWCTRSRSHQLAEPDFIRELRRLNGMPDELLQNKEWLELLLPTLRADFAVCEEYIYQPDRPLECPLSAYGGRDDPEVAEEEITAWRDQTQGAFTQEIFPGDHFFLHDARETLLHAIGQALSGLLKRLDVPSLLMAEPNIP